MKPCYLLAIVVVLTGCVGATRHETLKSLGFEAEYLDGYQDGCASRVEGGTTHLSGFYQDQERMYRDEAYVHGWDDGYRQCVAANRAKHY